MRRIVVGEFVSLDGVMQAPGGPEEDPSGGFKFGGWTVPYWSDQVGEPVGELFSQKFDLLLGRPVQLADDVIVLSHGQIVHEGLASDLSNEKLADLYQLN